MNPTGQPMKLTDRRPAAASRRLATDRRPQVLWRLIALLSLPVAACHPMAAAAEPTILAAADENTLWLAMVTGSQTQVCRRGISGPFQSLEPLNAPVTDLAVSGGVLFAFVEDGSFYANDGETWSRCLDLPDRDRPLAMTGDDGLLALVRSPRSGALPQPIGQPPAQTTRPFDPGQAPCSLVRYEPWGWAAIAAAPHWLPHDGPTPPRLAVIHQAIWLFAALPHSQRIQYTWLDPDSGLWRPAASIPCPATCQDFWVVQVGRVPTAVLASLAADGGQEVSALRLLSQPDSEHPEWRVTPLHLSSLPSGFHVKRYEAAFGFNQHVVLSMRDASGNLYLRFGRPDADVVEATLEAAEVFRQQPRPGPHLPWLQSVTLLVLFAILAALILLRRGSMVGGVALPEGHAPALAFQRLLGWAVDFVPFGAAAALLLRVDWQRGLRELSGWAVGSDAATGKLPEQSTLLWWAASCCGHVAYCLVIELATRRSLGKLLVGTRILSESAAPPAWGQTVIRNLLRLVEMLPPLWVLSLLVVLSRNRQRLGDIFARTVVVRRLGSGRQ